MTAAAALAQGKGPHNRSKVFTDPNRMRRAWLAAILRVPAGPGASRRLPAAQLPGWKANGGKTCTAVVSLHGCSGL
ncbi:MAG: hypothetical protein KDK24_05855 [Pseudooceanicola sp.]|nr:hypothetical protein [Pseudooceanicola sp.]